MEENIYNLMNQLNNKDNKTRKEALDQLLDMTEEKVDWIYDVWDILVDKLQSDNSYQRSIGVLLLSNLAKSDQMKKFNDLLNRYLGLMEDEKFITSRQTIQSAWKVAVAIESLRQIIIDYLFTMFSDNKHLVAHANLIRKDIAQSLVHIHNLFSEDVDLNLLLMKVESACDKKECKELVAIIKKG